MQVNSQGTWTVKAVQHGFQTFVIYKGFFPFQCGRPPDGTQKTKENYLGKSNE
jgi:hypothetical protein